MTIPMCQNANKCNKKNRCQSDNHANCPTIQCPDVASYGPKGTRERIYCKPCCTKLDRAKVIQKELFELHGKVCMSTGCTSKSEAKYGIRGTKTATHCTDCAKKFNPPLVLMGVKHCDYAENELLCGKQSKFVVNGKNYCAPHAKAVAELDKVEIISTSVKCIECKKSEPSIGKYCVPCAKIHAPDAKRTSGMCIDCGKVRASYKRGDSDKVEYCKPCVDKYSDETFTSCNKKCIKCNKIRATWMNGPGASPTRCEGCIPTGELHWISTSTGMTVQEKLDKEAALAQERLDKKSEPKKKNISDYCPKCPLGDTQKAKMYGWLTDGKKMYCKGHKDDGMINVVSKLCTCEILPDETEEKGAEQVTGDALEPTLCGKIATYGITLPNGKKLLNRCREHGSNMKNLVNGCCDLNCDNPDERALYGIRNRETDKSGKPTHCQPCGKLIPTMVDISHKLCQFTKNGLFVCDTRAGYPIEEGGPLHFCSGHNINNTIDVTHKKCSYVDPKTKARCTTRARYGIIKGNGTLGSAEKCLHHKDDNMANVIDRRCIKCYYGAQGQTPKLRTKYKNLCFNCWRDSSDKVETFTQKEDLIVTSLRECSELSEIKWTRDRPVGNGSLRRPDILIKLVTHNVIIEIDECQHQYGSYNDEDIRIIEIHYALNSAPLIVIRFNPDGYKIEEKQIKGLFAGKGKNVSIAHPKAYPIIINKLIAEIKQAIESIPTELITIKYLRYDQ